MRRETSHPLLGVDPEGEAPIYLQIMQQIRRLAAAGTLAPGAALPSVRQLAGELGVNPNTVSKAYQLLEAEGTLQGRRRRGCFVAARGPSKARLALDAGFADSLARFLSEGEKLGLAPGDLLTLIRERLEGGSADAGPKGGEP